MISISCEFVVKWRKGSNFFSFHEIIEKKKWEIIIKKILGKFSVLDNFPNSMLEAIYISNCMSPHFLFPYFDTLLLFVPFVFSVSTMYTPFGRESSIRIASFVLV